jgi:hypothetical protein
MQGEYMMNKTLCGALTRWGNTSHTNTTLVPEVYFYYFHCEGERKNKPLVESGN